MARGKFNKRGIGPRLDAVNQEEIEIRNARLAELEEERERRRAEGDDDDDEEGEKKEDEDAKDETKIAEASQKKSGGEKPPTQVTTEADHKRNMAKLAEVRKRREEADYMPNPPSELGISMHWLAVDGTQPEIPQNPSTVGFGAAAVSGVSPVLLDDDDSEQQAGDSHGIQVNQLQNSLLSEELQLYFTRVTLAMERGSSTADHRRQQDAVIVSVSRDAGLQELVPFLVRYCQREIYKHVSNAEHCRLLVRLAAALLHNPNIHLELQLHELLPALMTCVVAKRLAPSGNHWALRREAGVVLVQACNLFGDEYPTLKARVLRTLCDAAALGKTLPSRYGGIVTISYFGSKAVDAFLLPTALGSWRRWETDLQQTKDLAEAYQIEMCQQAMLDAIGIFFRRSSLEEKADRVALDELEDTLGDKWIVFQDESYPYATCFV